MTPLFDPVVWDGRPDGELHTPHRRVARKGKNWGVGAAVLSPDLDHVIACQFVTDAVSATNGQSCAAEAARGIAGFQRRLGCAAD